MAAEKAAGTPDALVTQQAKLQAALRHHDQLCEEYYALKDRKRALARADWGDLFGFPKKPTTTPSWEEVEAALTMPAPSTPTTGGSSAAAAATRRQCLARLRRRQLPKSTSATRRRRCFLVGQGCQHPGSAGSQTCASLRRRCTSHSGWKACRQCLVSGACARITGLQPQLHSFTPRCVPSSCALFRLCSACPAL